MTVFTQKKFDEGSQPSRFGPRQPVARMPYRSPVIPVKDWSAAEWRWACNQYYQRQHFDPSGRSLTLQKSYNALDPRGGIGGLRANQLSTRTARDTASRLAAKFNKKNGTADDLAARERQVQAKEQALQSLRRANRREGRDGAAVPEKPFLGGMFGGGAEYDEAAADEARIVEELETADLLEGSGLNLVSGRMPAFLKMFTRRELAEIAECGMEVMQKRASWEPDGSRNPGGGRDDPLVPEPLMLYGTKEPRQERLARYAALRGVPSRRQIFPSLQELAETLDSVRKMPDMVYVMQDAIQSFRGSGVAMPELMRAMKKLSRSLEEQRRAPAGSAGAIPSVHAMKKRLREEALEDGAVNEFLALREGLGRDREPPRSGTRTQLPVGAGPHLDSRQVDGTFASDQSQLHHHHHHRDGAGGGRDDDDDDEPDGSGGPHRGHHHHHRDHDHGDRVRSRLELEKRRRDAQDFLRSQNTYRAAKQTAVEGLSRRRRVEEELFDEEEEVIAREECDARPFLLQQLIYTRNLSRHGVYVWSAPERGTEVLQDASLDATAKLEKYLGFTFNWTHFPRVRVAEVGRRRTGSGMFQVGGSSSSASNKFPVMEGDILLGVNGETVASLILGPGYKDRDVVVPAVAEGAAPPGGDGAEEGSSSSPGDAKDKEQKQNKNATSSQEDPDEILVKQLQQRWTSFAFLQGECARQYLQLTLTSRTLGVEFRPGTGKISVVNPKGFAARNGLIVGDEILTVNDRLCESHREEGFYLLMWGQRVRPLDLLFRRAKGYPHAARFFEENFFEERFGDGTLVKPHRDLRVLVDDERPGAARYGYGPGGKLLQEGAAEIAGFRGGKAPFLLQILLQSRKPTNLDCVRFYSADQIPHPEKQNHIENVSLTSTQKMMSALGFTLDWVGFPYVYVAQSNVPAQVPVGSCVLLCAGERVTMVATWKGRHADEAVLRKVHRAGGDRDELKFAFLTEPRQYLQVAAPVAGDGDLKIDPRSGKVAEVRDWWAKKYGVAVGDELVAVEDILMEKQTAHALDRLADGEKTNLLFRRRGPGYPEPVWRKQELGAQRPLPPGWLEEAIRRQKAKVRSPTSVATVERDDDAASPSGASQTKKKAGSKVTFEDDGKKDAAPAVEDKVPVVDVKKKADQAPAPAKTPEDEPAAPAQTKAEAGPSPASKAAATPPPYCAQFLGMSKNMPGAGLAGWGQSSIDAAVLKSTSIPPSEKVQKLFGMKLDWSGFPVVRVTKIEPKLPDGSGPSRAAKNGVVEGDMLIMVATLQDRVTTVTQWEGNGPDDALIRKITRKEARKDNPVASFAFLRKKKANQYVQLVAGVGEKALGFQVAGAGKLTAVTAGGWAATRGLKVGDALAVAGDLLYEKQGREVEKRIGEGGPRPLHLLFRRESEFPQSTLDRGVDVTRPLPSAWASAVGPRPEGANNKGAAAAESSPAADSKKESAAVSPASGAAPKPRDGPPPPYCAQFLGATKNVAGWGLAGWAQSSIDAAILNDAAMSPEEKLDKLFGVKLDWRGFPIVTVTSVSPKLPDGSGPSRAAKNGVAEGDMMVMACTLQDRITTVVQWEGKSPADALIKKCQRKAGRKDNPVAAFAFLRKKKLPQYVQLESSEGDLGLTVDDKGQKITAVAAGGWAEKQGLRAGDVIAVVNDQISEKQGDKCKELVAKGGKRPVNILFRREAEFPAPVLKNAVNVTRALPTAWAAAVGGATSPPARGGGGGAAAAPPPSVAPSSPGPSPSAPKGPKKGPDGPYCAQFLGMAKDLPAYGLAGWAQSSIDNAILNDAAMPASEKVLKLFGMALDWSDFPIVRVTKVEPKMPDGSGPSRAAKNGVAEGDMLLMVCTLQDRVTTVGQWEGSSPSDAIIKKVQRKAGRKDNPVAAFVFLRKKKANQYVQLEAQEKVLGMKVEGGKLTDVTPGGWADRRGLKAGDVVAVAGDVLSEKKPAEVDKRVGDGGPRPLHILFRREAEFSDPTCGGRVVDCRRQTPPAWAAAPPPSVAPSSPGPSPSAPKGPKKGPDGPYCAQFLGMAKDLPAYGLAGWAQSSIDNAILNDAAMPASEKVVKLFGMALDWSDFPIVRVTKVEPKMPDGSGPSRAAKNGVAEGDMLLMVCTLQDRVTTVGQWEGSSPSDAIIKKVQRKAGRKDNPVAAFVFLRKKKANQYVQLEAQEKVLGMKVEGGKLTDVTPGGWADRRGLKAGDVVAVAGDVLSEKKPAEVDKRVGDGGPRPLHILFRREAEFSDPTCGGRVVDCRRQTPPAWAAAPPPSVAPSSPSPSPSTPKGPKKGPDAPYCAQFLGMAKNLQGYGLAGWAQSSIDNAILNDAAMPAPEKVLKLFGMALDWSDFPIVRVTKVEAKMPDDSGPSRAAKNGVVEGDMLVMVCTLQDRMTTVAQWEGSSPSDAIIKKVQRKAGRKDNPVAAFAFLRKKKANQYVQLEAQEKVLGMKVEGGKLTDVTPGGWADRRGLKAGDVVAVAGDVLSEKQPAEVDKRVGDGGPRPLHILFRREAEFSDPTCGGRVVDCRRQKPPGWKTLE